MLAQLWKRDNKKPSFVVRVLVGSASILLRMQPIGTLKLRLLLLAFFHLTGQAPLRANCAHFDLPTKLTMMAAVVGSKMKSAPTLIMQNQTTQLSSDCFCAFNDTRRVERNINRVVLGGISSRFLFSDLARKAAASEGGV